MRGKPRVAHGTAKGPKRRAAASREPGARTPFTPSDAVCALLLLTVAGVAVEAAQLAGAARLLMLGATALALLIGFRRPQVWAAIAAIVAVTGGTAAGAMATEAGGTSARWIAASAMIAATLGCAAIWSSILLRHLSRRMREHRRAIDALTRIDPASGVLKPHAGRDWLRAEVARAVRYRRHFSLLVGKACDWDAEVGQRGMDAARELHAVTLRTAAAALRGNDIIAHEPDDAFMVVLPETIAEGGEAAARRIREAVRGLLDVRFGLVQCPDDGETEDALLREAYEALAFAEMANLPIASRRALMGDGAD